MTNASRPVVLIAEKLAESAIEALGDGVEIRHVDGTDRPALLDAVGEADALLVRSATKVDAEVLGATTQLKRISGRIPPITVTSAATASATETGHGKRGGTGSCGAFIYIRTATRR